MFALSRENQIQKPGALTDVERNKRFVETPKYARCNKAGTSSIILIMRIASEPLN